MSVEFDHPERHGVIIKFDCCTRGPRMGGPSTSGPGMGGGRPPVGQSMGSSPTPTSGAMSGGRPSGGPPIGQPGPRGGAEQSHGPDARGADCFQTFVRVSPPCL